MGNWGTDNWGKRAVDAAATNFAQTTLSSPAPNPWLPAPGSTYARAFELLSLPKIHAMNIEIT